MRMSVLFKVEYESYCEVTRESDPDDQYSGEDTSTSHWVNGLKVVNDNTFDVGGSFSEAELKKADNKVYMVNVIYSTGDSFSSNSGSGIEFVECFLTLEKAEKLVALIENHYSLVNKSNGKDEYMKFLKNEGLLEKIEAHKDYNPEYFNSFYALPLYYLDEQDELKMISVPWGGYFESIDNVSVESLVATPKSIPKETKKRRLH